MKDKTIPKMEIDLNEAMVLAQIFEKTPSLPLPLAVWGRLYGKCQAFTQKHGATMPDTKVEKQEHKKKPNPATRKGKSKKQKRKR